MCNKNCNECGVEPLCTERQSNPLDEIVTETRSLNPIKEEKSMATKERITQSLNTYIEMFGLPYDNIKEDTKKMLVNWMDDTLNGRWTSLADMAEKERDSMNNYEKIEITFKSGETISYSKGEWDDYAYDGKAVIVKKNSTWIGIYNFDDVFCVELK